jgi:hypothetical protein
MKSIGGALLVIALAPLLSKGAFLDDLAAKSNKTEESPFAKGGDIILKISSREYVHIFTNVNTESTFELTERSIARILCVGGGGPGGRCNNYGVPGGGGGAGGFVETNNVVLTVGGYAINVGKGGVSSAASVANNSGGQSAIVKRGWTDIVRAHGGGGGGTPSSYSILESADDPRCGRDGASGGGSCAWDYGDKTGIGGNALYGAEGHRGGLAKGGKEGGGTNNRGGGGGGAGAAGNDNYVATNPGKGGDGLSSDITGDELWYAGGGAGGFKYESSSDNNIAGGLGGGGSVKFDRSAGALAAWDAVPGTGGGGYGGTFYNNADSRVGCGADGIVIVRVVRAPEGFKVSVR